ncbi:hypothetical protein DFQ15_1232 [Xylophilus ampelinus]|uniref:Uncharacterized protein n=2 Tax=Xylophilus ampelinus TaxID=54067 RepID=A0A318SF18_9BURK|nr:hypothetical protein DFQ15_1232 [Xylophilus ampelinus]
MPAPGLWGISAELNGSPGRGFQIEVENEVAVLSYYGYRADGSSVFYSAVGPIKDNRFSAPLMEYRGGTPLGAGFRNGTEAGSPGTVTLDFRTGKSGTITLPGESPKAVVKFSFGYPPTPEGLFGTYLLTYVGPNFVNSDFYSLTRALGSGTSTGSGIAVNPAGNFGCENQTSGALAGSILCVEANNSPNDDYYSFKMSGDRGAGVGTWQAVQQTASYSLFVTRTHTRTGRPTGINDSTPSSLDLQLAPLQENPSPSNAHGDAARQQAAYRIQSADVTLTDEETRAFAAWRQDAQSLLRSAR